MSTQQERLNELIQKAIQLFDFTEPKYGEEIEKIKQLIIQRKLTNIIDPSEFNFIFTINMRDIRRRQQQDEYEQKVKDYFRIKEVKYYYQLPELRGFPDNYSIGFGELIKYDLLPEQVKQFAQRLTLEDVNETKTTKNRFLKDMIDKIYIPSDPQIGHWLKIVSSAVSTNIRLNNAFQMAESTLDILRIANPASKIVLPQYSIGLSEEDEAHLAGKFEFHRYPYQAQWQNLVDELTDLCSNPDTDLKKRIKNALFLFRIGDNYAPNEFKLLFYVAGIEHLILGGNDRDVLRWKFSEKGAILLGNNLESRIELSRQLKKIYDLRSTIAHGSETEYNSEYSFYARTYLKNSILKTLQLINTLGLQTVTPKKSSSPQTSLDHYLNNIIFSGVYPSE